ncbi:MAG TPA: hypothetical protein ENJ32_05690, partial [Crenotrichaceae bacterium]|nr:hypothetical protein [Crenotrichaceae bacterium]
MKNAINTNRLIAMCLCCLFYAGNAYSLIAVQSAHSGVWFNPQQNGHGFFLSIGEQQQQLNLVISWYHYEQGEQRYVVGSQTFDAETGRVNVPVQETHGANFGEAFKSTDVERIDWGTLTVAFNSCDRGTIEYQTLSGQSGTIPVQRLAGVGTLECTMIELDEKAVTVPAQTLVQQPFVCSTVEEGLGQPLIDNQVAGWPVFDDSGVVTGFSENCRLEPSVSYRYRSTQGDIKTYTPDQPAPDDLAMTTLINGDTVPYMIRWERGTMNRFIYSIATLAPGILEGNLGFDETAWNKRLLYYFQGGVGIGHSQGDTSQKRMLYDDALKRGYAVIYSTGTSTSTHYNLARGGRTALQLKDYFISEYGEPLYTIGIGASGGGVQQYVYAQNHPGLIDAAIPQYAFPDMITQTIHISDCELLEYYMDVTDSDNSMWSTWSNRTILEGMNASDKVKNRFLLGLRGSTECVAGWRGLTPLLINPFWGKADNQEQMQPETLTDDVKWTHWQDSAEIYGLRADGHAPNTLDNVG